MARQATEDGLRLGDGRVLAWADVYHLEWTADAALLATGQGVIEVSREVGEAVERRLAPWEAQREAAVLTPPAERLTASIGWGARFAGWTIGLLATVLLVCVVGGLAPWPTAFIALVAGVVAGAIFAAGAPATLDAAGLTVGRRQVPWAALREYHEGPSALLLTKTGRVTLGPRQRGGEQLRAALRTTLAQRQAAAPADLSRGSFAPSVKRAGDGLWLDDDGLVIVERQNAQRLPWSELRAPHWLPQGPQLQAAGRTLDLSRYVGGAELAQAIDARLGGGESLTDADGELRGEVIERWLGVEPGGALRCGLSAAKVWGCGLGLLLGAVGLICLLVGADGHGGGAVQGVFAAVMMFVAMVRSARAVDADAQGLSVRSGGRRTYYAWSDIESVYPGQYEWVIVTRAGELRLAHTASGHERVIGIIRRLLAARASGAVLPSDAPVPEVALSLMGAPGSPEAERGLSVTWRGEASSED